MLFCKARQLTDTLSSSLARRIAVAASALTLAFVLIVGGVSYVVARAEIRVGVLERLEEEALFQAQRASGRLAAVSTTLSQLTRNSLVLNSLVDSLHRETSLVPFLEGFSTINGVPVVITLTDFAGEPIAGASWLPDEIEGWQQSVLEEGRAEVTFRDTGNGAALIVAEPVLFQGTPGPEGALIYRLMLAELLPPETAKHSADLVHRLTHATATAPIIRKGGIDQTGEENWGLRAVRQLEVPEPFRALQLAVEVSGDRNLLERPLGRLLLGYSFAGLLLVGAAVGLSVLAARHLAGPLRRLEEVASMVVASGSLHHRVDSGGSAEIKSLGNAFNRMLERLSVASEQTERGAAELALRNQSLAAANQALEREIVDRERSELALRESRARLASIYESASDGILVMDLDADKIVDVNPGAAELLGYSRSELMQLRVSQIYPHSEALHEFARETRLRGRHATDALVCLTRSGAELPVEVSGSMFRLGEGWALLQILRDVSERKNAQDALAERAAALARSNTELEQFAYVASHDLQEPLRKVQTFSDLLERDLGARIPPKQRDYLQRMRASCQRMQEMIDDLLAFSRLSTGAERFEPIPLETLIDEVSAEFLFQLSHCHGCIEIMSLPTVLGSRSELFRLFQNLIGNAIKYRRPDVALRITVSAATADADGSPHGGGIGRGELVEIRVQDNGMGFEQEYAERIFGVFQRLHGRQEHGGGTGIGLAICRKIVENHGGSIRAEGAPGQGAQFVIALPLAASDERLCASTDKTTGPPIALPTHGNELPESEQRSVL
jgi:two-component system sensor kinase FixL